MKFLESEIKRLKTIDKYLAKMESSKKEKDKNYFLESIHFLLSSGETTENFLDIKRDYENALEAKKLSIEKLLNEIKIIKRLKI